MSPRRILAVARRIAQGFRRDHRSLGLLVVAPLLVTGLLGWVIRDSTEARVNVILVNEAGEPGQRIVDALIAATTNAPDGVEVVSYTDPTQADDPLEAARTELRDGRVHLALVIPGTFAEDMAAGRRPTLTVITAGVEPTAEAEQFGKLQAIMPTLVQQLVPPGGQAPPLPRIERETVFLSPDAGQLDVLAPVFLGLFAYFFVFVLTGISFLRERVGGTLERLLATPITRAEIVVGYSLGFGFFATLQVLILTAFILSNLEVPAIGPLPAFTLGLGVQSSGSPAIAFLVALLLAIGAVNLGIFLSTFARTELQIVQFIPLVIVPQTLLGGIFWPVERLPDVLQAVARVLPVTYAVDALREVMLKGADLASDAVRLDLAVLAAIAVVFVVLAAATIKREIA